MSCGGGASDVGGAFSVGVITCVIYLESTLEGDDRRWFPFEDVVDFTNDGNFPNISHLTVRA